MNHRKVLRAVAERTPLLASIVKDHDDLRRRFVKAQARERDLMEQLALQREKQKANQGYCHCCRHDVLFEIRASWLRDHYLCSRCGSIPRQRHLQYILDRQFPEWESSHIHESSPSNNYLGSLCSKYTVSQYFDGVPPGAEVNGVRCENLEALTFNDAEFDFFITQDVFEHIFDPARAAAEIMRVLKPGGAHVFTAPKHATLSQSRCRAILKDGAIQHLEPEEYHGNPVGDGRALVTWDYGHDFEFLLGQWTGCPVTTYLTRDRGIGLDGEFLEVFVVKKPV